ncbi:unnamed protein product [Adineta steineri]|uniref:Uncharacterized protein n=1 Tax=Adineta steineri TaxID=433720 RepID=A0A814EYW8_9BILA|nr:unnamed protein product [Adineta steineri]CAF3780729.1 unnamed protein product [Adineta steineri]
MSSSTVSRYRESTSVTTPTKIYDQNDASFAEEEALDAIAKEAELRLYRQREQNREARQIRHKELEKNAQDNDDDDSPTSSHASSTPIESTKSTTININPTIGINTNTLLLQKFLNGDIDLRTIEQRDLRRLLSELESKYKILMITNSSMYNEKQSLHYQIDNYKDLLEEYCETSNQAKRQLKEKSREFDLQKRTLNDLQQDYNKTVEILTNCEKLIEEYDVQKFSTVSPTESNSRETLILLNSFANGSIDEKFKRILNEKHEQYDELLKLKSELDEEKTRLRILTESRSDSLELHNQNMNDECDSEQQKQLMKEIMNLENRLQRLDTDNGSLQQENKRYEAQLARYKQQLDDGERVEEELKQERRALQRELRNARDDYEKERTRSDVLQRENERLRTSRNNNLLSNTDDNIVISRSHSPLLPTNSNDIQSNSPIEDTN